jgi:hypothetical protein
MEDFVQAITVGGLAFVAGLWVRTLGSGGAATEILALGLILLGIAGLGYGLWDVLEE